MLTNTQE